MEDKSNMFRKLKNVSFNLKVMFFPVLLVAGILVVQLLNQFLDHKVMQDVIYPNLEQQILGRHRDVLKHVVDVEAATLVERLKQANTREEKIATVIAETDPIRFFQDGSGYFFTYDLSGVRVNVPINKAQNGQNLISLEDKKGIRFVEEFVKTAKNGGGFVEYYFEKEGKGIQPKLSYVKTIPGTDFLIGTGVYTDNVESEKAELERHVGKEKSRYFRYLIAIFLVLLLVAAFLSLLISRSLTGSICKVTDGLATGIDQVASAAGRILSSSRQWAEGASEQAASLEEASSSLEEIASMTRQNADNASQANQLIKGATEVVERADASMTLLTVSMREISGASEETQKIIKTIDEIAFQTNLLALNAAVEAARAGEAGAGFAVVADEVRNLAMRAAEAARNTAALIEGTVKKVKEGSDLVAKTNQEFKAVADIVNTSEGLIGEIAAASLEQAGGIGQVSQAIAGLDKVTQQNASDSEESASLATVMHSQAEQMRGFIAGLTGGKGNGERYSTIKEEANVGILSNAENAKKLPIRSSSASGRSSSKNLSPSKLERAPQLVPPRSEIEKSKDF
jgi:methyl-accepting chemotaxis protein